MKSEMKIMREEAQKNKIDLLEELEKREDKWEKDKKEMVGRIAALENIIQDMYKKVEESEVVEKVVIEDKLEELE